MRQIRTGAHPRIYAPRSFAMQRSVGCEQSLRLSSLFRFIHRSAFERHWHWIRLIDARIVELALYKNGHGDQRCLAIAELQNPQSARALHLFRILGFGWFFVSGFLRTLKLRFFLRPASRSHRGKHRQNDDDDRP
jgi:hypothetical protein